MWKWRNDVECNLPAIDEVEAPSQACEDSSSLAWNKKTDVSLMPTADVTGGNKQKTAALAFNK